MLKDIFYAILIAMFVIAFLGLEEYILWGA